MVEGIVKKIMLTGIEKYAKIYQEPSENVQIKVTNDPNGNVFYAMCKNMVEVEKVTFLNIMDKKMDFFGYQTLASPFLKKTLSIFAEEQNCNVDDVNLFIMKYKTTLCLAFYNKFKNGKTVLLAKQLQELGL
jgi:hypothetical protein